MWNGAAFLIRRGRGTIKSSDLFEVFLVFALGVLGIVFVTKFFAIVVAVLLKLLDLGGEASEVGHPALVLFGIGGEQLSRFRSEEEFGETGGCDLKADFGNFGGVVLAKKSDEVVLVHAKFESMIFSETPLLVTAKSFPIGNVALGGLDLVFVERVDDLQWCKGASRR